MIHEGSPDYGFVPKNIRDELDLSSTTPVSGQIKDLVGVGRVGVDGISALMRALQAEAQFIIETTKDDILEANQRRALKSYTCMLREPVMQRELCETIASSYWHRINFSGQPESQFNEHLSAAQNWINLKDQIGTSNKIKPVNHSITRGGFRVIKGGKPS